MAGVPPVGVGRVYDERGPADGRRVLVDRLWPRGMRREDPRVDVWLRDVAPSTELRRWYGHREAVFGEFRRRYAAELSDPDAAAAVDELRGWAQAGRVTLLTASRAVEISHAAVLADLVREARQQP
jgi:uncharacterized protein YeaO (DUF488 family)